MGDEKLENLGNQIVMLMCKLTEERGKITKLEDKWETYEEKQQRGKEQERNVNGSIEVTFPESVVWEMKGNTEALHKINETLERLLDFQMQIHKENEIKEESSRFWGK